MKPRDRVAGWAAVALLVLLAFYCSVWVEGCTHSIEALWRGRHDTQEESE